VRRFVILLIVLSGLAFAGLAWGYATALRDPVVRQAHVGLPRWPAGAAPVRAVLMSDVHVGGPDMPPERLRRIVRQINGLRPDIVLIAGDFVSDKRSGTRRYPAEAAGRPLREIRAPLGTFAVLGNHDHWRSEAGLKRALRNHGVTVLDNQSVSAGPLAIGGLDDAFTGHHDLRGTVRALRATPGAKLMLSHSPDPFPDLPGDMTLMVAGHTHCGQIAPPLMGPVTTFSKYGRRYACGMIREGGKTLVVSAGLGTSVLPLRIGAVPDLWLLELGPLRRGGAR